MAMPMQVGGEVAVAVVAGEEEKVRLGSSPPRCYSKCCGSSPCVAVQVPTLSAPSVPAAAAAAARRRAARGDVHQLQAARVEVPVPRPPVRPLTLRRARPVARRGVAGRVHGGARARALAVNYGVCGRVACPAAHGAALLLMLVVVESLSSRRAERDC